MDVAEALQALGARPRARAVQTLAHIDPGHTPEQRWEMASYFRERLWADDAQGVRGPD